MSFTGTGVRWIVAKGPMLRKANIYLDGVFLGQVDLDSPTLEFRVSLERFGLMPGTHSLVIEVSGAKNTAASGYIVDLDSLEVFP